MHTPTLFRWRPCSHTTFMQTYSCTGQKPACTLPAKLNLLETGCGTHAKICCTIKLYNSSILDSRHNLFYKYSMIHNSSSKIPYLHTFLFMLRFYTTGRPKNGGTFPIFILITFIRCYTNNTIESTRYPSDHMHRL